ncbi:DMT family transporter [Inquilinus sp. CAU 1745]|uniref:DMT family transporter n=1 Tax=Inquilinus sp. CAU 1745 TaxID=3140369 RepID=UPI00325BC045
MSATKLAGPAAGSVVLRGIGLYTLAVFLLSLMDAVVKWLTDDFGTAQLVFFRSLFGLLPLMVLIARSGGLSALATRRPGAQMLRGLIGMGAAFFFYYAFSVMPLADAYAIAFAAPIFITALSVPLLGESVGVRRWSAVGVGFLGVIVMLRPGTTDLAGFLSIGALAALAGTFCYALSTALIRKLTRTETNASLIFYSAIVVIAISGVMMTFDFRTPTGWQWVLLVATGLLGGTATLALTEAFRIAPVAILAPFEYTAMVWAVLLGFWLWGDLPDLWIIAGSLIVVGSGLYILHRETRNRVPPSSPSARVPEPAGEL